MKKSITIKNDIPHLIEALWNHPDCPRWFQDVIWDGINNRVDGGTEMSAAYWTSCLESVKPDEPGEHEERYGFGDADDFEKITRPVRLELVQ